MAGSIAELHTPRAPRIVGIGGTTRASSTTERAIRVALAAAAAEGAEVCFLGAEAIELPTYAPERPERSERAARMIAELRRADGVIVGSPGYHGGISGLVKNALDYIEEMRGDDRPYLDGRAVGCIVVASGWQATVTTLVALRSVVHSLRGWPTPLGVAINSSEPVFDASGQCLQPPVSRQLEVLGCQVVDFAKLQLGRA